MKKGFTLIELLAVIVILAIIALIATPIVLSIIDETKESAVLRSVEHYLSAVENSIAKKSLSIGGSFSPDICEVQSNGDLLCDDKDELKIEVSGEKPSSGTITFEKGKIVDVELTQSNKTIVKNEKGQLVLGEGKKEPVCKLVENGDVAPSGITPGDKYQCKVKDNMEAGWEDGYYFYVLSSEEDGTTNLIMDRNIYYDSVNDVGKAATFTNKGLVAWSSTENDAGPVTAMTYLDNATNTWENIDNLNITYDDEGEYFTGFAITGKARMPYYSEVGSYDGTNGFLYTNLDGGCYDEDWNAVACEEAEDIMGVHEEGMEHIYHIYGYWTLSSDPDIDEEGYAAVVAGYGDDIDCYGCKETNYYFGVRPVINLKI